MWGYAHPGSLVEQNATIGQKFFNSFCGHCSFRFMDNLQTEMLEIEFLTYSKGMTTISEEDFARILLRYTNVEDIRSYLENVRQCIPDEKVMSNVTWLLTNNCDTHLPHAPTFTP